MFVGNVSQPGTTFISDNMFNGTQNMVEHKNSALWGNSARNQTGCLKGFCRKLTRMSCMTTASDLLGRSV